MSQKFSCSMTAARINENHRIRFEVSCFEWSYCLVNLEKLTTVAKNISTK